MTQFAPPAYPAQQFPQQQQFGQPQYPAQQYAQPQYAPPPMPGYPPMQVAPQAPPLAQGSIDDFYNQPSTGGGKALSFEQLGTRYVGIVTRAITSGDIQQQTDTQQRPLFFKDGRPKFVMRVPLQMQPSPARPDGTGTWYVKGATRDELARAMGEAGAPAGPPEPGSILDITFTGTRPSGAGMNPAKLFHVGYTRPDGQTPSPAPAPVQPQPAPMFVPPAQPAYVEQQPVVQYAPPQQPIAPQALVQAPPQQMAQPAPPADLSPEQQALLARLTGGAPTA